MGTATTVRSSRPDDAKNTRRSPSRGPLGSTTLSASIILTPSIAYSQNCTTCPARRSNTITHCLDIFIQPALRRFSFIVDGDDASAALMDLLASRSPAIEVVPHLTINSYTPSFLSSITRALCPWKHLTEFSFSRSMGEEALQCLSMLPCLRYLHIHLYESHGTPLLRRVRQNTSSLPSGS